MIDFKKYDTDNPQIWEQFKKFSFEAKAKGFSNYSAKGIFEIIRWHTSTSGNDVFKLNNNYHADYARKMMAVFPEFEGFFRLRELKASRTEILPKLSEVKEAEIGKRYLTDDGAVIECVLNLNPKSCEGCCYRYLSSECKNTPLCSSVVRSDKNTIIYKHDKSHILNRVK